VETLYCDLRSSESSDEPVTLSNEARQEWVRWYNENATTLETVSGLARGVYAKLPAQCARFALILHCLTHRKQPTRHAVSLNTMTGAIELAEYFRSHAHRVLPKFNDTNVITAAGLHSRVLRILHRNLGSWISRTTIYRELGSHTPAVEIESVLASMLEQGIVETQVESSGERGGRPSEQWRVVTQERRNPTPLDRSAA